MHPCFSALPGEFIHKKEKIVHAFYFPQNSPPHAPLLSRPDGRPCECDNILTSKELFYRSHLRHFIDHGYLKLELIEPGVQYIDA